MTADPNTAEEYAAAGAAASRRLRLSLGDAAGRNRRVVVYADDLRTVLDDYDVLAEAWETDQDDELAPLPDLREVTQSLLPGNEHGFPGDCIRASVASLLDLDPAKVPHFISEDDVRVWPLALKAFVAEHGWDIKRRTVEDGDPLPDFGIAIGTTTRPAASHAVVVRDGEMVWDPHPSRDGLVEVKQVIDFTRASTERDRLLAYIAQLEAHPWVVAKSAPSEQLQDGDVRPGHGPGVPGAMHLNAFGQSVAAAMGARPYHVGSSLTSKKWRDVDVRVILDDERFAALFPGFATAHHVDAWWSLFCAAMSELGRARTGLPIDFQVQSMTEANEKYPGPRNPLILFPARDEDWPRMDARDHGKEFLALLHSGASVSPEDQAALAEYLREAQQEQPGCGPQCSEMHTYEPGRCEAAVVRTENGVTGDVQQAEIKRTPDEWCQQYLIEVHDPDGWRDPDAPAWGEPITLADFYRRVRRSTLRNVVSVDWEGLARDAEESENG